MASVMMQVASNMLEGKDKFDGIDKDNVMGTYRVNIPYSIYTGEGEDKK
jgi:methyl-galactoside transport system substrate-binding protein